MGGSSKAPGFGMALLVLAVVAAPFAQLSPAEPARSRTTFTVTKTADSRDGACTRRDCSLREAIIAANAAAGADTISVPPGVYPLKRRPKGDDTAASGDLDVTDSLEIIGAGARRTVIDASDIPGGERAIDVLGAGTNLAVERLTIKGGRDGEGGGIRSAGPLTLTAATVRGNRASFGGGVASAVSLTLLRSTISGNRTASDGGGVRAAGTVTIINSTISGNSITGGGNGAGIGLGLSTTLTATNVTIANNSSAETARGAVSGPASASATFENSLLGNAPTANCFFLAVNSDGHNLSSDASCDFDQGSDQTDAEPKLGSLRDNGGPTDTHALRGGSPAIDTGGEGAPPDDQRRVARPQGAASDIGAFEKKPTTPRQR